MQFEIQEIQERVREKSAFIERLQAEMQRTIVGQKYMLDRLLIGLLAQGHILVEGVPGLAKTLAVKTLAQSIRTQFRRIQFTPDLLPADLLGTMIYQQKTGEFIPKKGPIFANVILADEINRAPAKVQSALLEAMQERQVTIGDTTFPLEEPFLVMATQNPIEHEGTYPLPEAQVDRFMLKLRVEYPSAAEERQILDRMAEKDAAPAQPVVDPAEILEARETLHMIYMDDKLKDYIVQLVLATREPSRFGLDIKGLIEYGASPRATIFLSRAAKSYAFLRRRGFVTPDDIKSVGLDVLRHRIILTYEAEAEEVATEEIIRRVFDKVPVP